MREIKFRGKRVDNGEWIYGFLIEYASGNLKITIPECRKDLQKKSNIIYGTYTIIPETLGQFIGLTDKNGKEIYEGDIIRSNCGRLFEVYWSKKDSAFYWEHFVIDKKKRFNKNSVVAGSYEIEVIGSIFDKDNILKED